MQNEEFGNKKSDKQCAKALQKIRQQQNCTFHGKNQNTKQINQQQVAHGTAKVQHKIQ